MKLKLNIIKNDFYNFSGTDFGDFRTYFFLSTYVFHITNAKIGIKIAAELYL